MEEDKKLVEALTRRLGEAAKEYAELEVRFHACLDKCARLEEHLKENAKASEVGKRISHNEHPILTTGVSIGCLDFSVLSQGRVYRLFYDDGGERKELYFAPKAYYPAERLLECYFVIGTKGDHFEQAFIPRMASRSPVLQQHCASVSRLGATTRFHACVRLRRYEHHCFLP